MLVACSGGPRARGAPTRLLSKTQHERLLKEKEHAVAPPTALKRRKQTPTNARIELKPLTHQQRAEVNKVKEAYGDFWRHIKFRHGIEEPLFGREEVESLLEKAAEIVVRVRSCIDEAQETGLHFRMLCGLAH